MIQQITHHYKYKLLSNIQIKTRFLKYPRFNNKNCIYTNRVLHWQLKLQDLLSIRINCITCIAYIISIMTKG